MHSFKEIFSLSETKSLNNGSKTEVFTGSTRQQHKGRKKAC